MLKWLNEDHPDLYAGVIGAILTRDDAEAFCEKLRINMPAHVYRQRRNLFVLGLEKGAKELDWNVHIPAPIGTYKREAPYFTRSAMFSLVRLREIENRFLESLNRPIPEIHHVVLGYIVFSAAMYGGLIDRYWLIAWLKDPFYGLVYDHHIAWVELYRSLTGKQNDSDVQGRRLHRRWFPDPLTLLLMGKLQRFITQAQYKRTNPWQYLLALMEHLEIPGPTRPKSLAEFLGVAHTRVALHSKTYLADYAASKLKSASLPPEIWARLRSGKSLPIKAEASYFEAEQSRLVKQLSIPVNKVSMTPSMWRKLYEAIYPNVSRSKAKRSSSAESKKNIQEFLDQYGVQLNPIGWLLAEWAKHLLSYKPGNRKGSKIAASSVYQYITTIAKPLSAHLGDEDIRGLSESEFYELYRDAIEQKSSEDIKKTTALRLSEFHEYLVHVWDVPPLDLSEFYRGHYKSELGVDANIICPAMYDGIIQALGGMTSSQPRQQQMLVLMTILGQKCGLRRAEVMTLLCSDIIGRYDPVLFVRHNPYAYKKSDNAIRQFPLKAFLTHKELNLLKKWVIQRDNEDSIANLDPQQIDNRRLLFCQPGEPRSPVDEESAFRTIHLAMRQVTKDQTVHFHTLRHSFASWFLFRMEASDDPFWRPNSVAALNAPSNSFRRSVTERARLALSTQASRKSLYQLAQSCGHASPEMSLRHYVHILDLMLGLTCWRPTSQPHLSSASLMNITGLGQARVYRIKQESGQGDWLPSIYVPAAFKKLKHQFKDGLAPSLKEMDTSPIVIAPKPLAWSTIQSVLEDRLIQKMSGDQLVQKYSIEPDTLSQWIARAGELYRMTTRSTAKHPKGKPRHRNSEHLLRDSKRLSFLDRPLSRYDNAMTNRIFDRYQRADQNHKQVILEGVRYFVDHFSLSSGDLRFTDKALARTYTEFLSAIGIKPNEIRLIHYRGKGFEAVDAQAQLGNWAKALSVPFDQCELASSPPGQSKNDGTIGITLSSATGRTGKGRKAKTIKASMPYGFRYALYILYIIG